MDRVGGKMNKAELIDKIATLADVSKTDASQVLNAAIDTITHTLAKGESVAIVGFGTFKVSERNAHEGRNPKTGETITIAAAKRPRFTAGKQLKEAVNHA
jgi:DNA-binding protein HU-beta